MRVRIETMVVVVAVQLLVFACAQPLGAAGGLRPEELQKAQHSVFSRMTEAEKVMLVRCQLCHDILESVNAHVIAMGVRTEQQQKSAAAVTDQLPTDEAKAVASNACAIVEASLLEGGSLYEHRGAQYAGAAMPLVKESCGLLMDDLTALYETYVDELIAAGGDASKVKFPPCETVCPGANERKKQQERMAEAVRSIRQAEQRQSQEGATGDEGGSVRPVGSSAEHAWVGDALLFAGLTLVALVSWKAYRLAAKDRPSAASSKRGQRKTTRSSS